MNKTKALVISKVLKGNGFEYLVETPCFGVTLEFSDVNTLITYLATQSCSIEWGSWS